MDTFHGRWRLDAGLNGVVTAQLGGVLTGPYANFNEYKRAVVFIHLNSAAGFCRAPGLANIIAGKLK